MSDPSEPGTPDASSPPPAFTARDPGAPEFWSERFERGYMPWDQAGVPASFQAFAERHADAAVLIPGCGSAWEALWLASRGRQVRAIDFSPAAVDAARSVLGAHADTVEQADFFAYRPPFEPGWIYERAFLCALPLAMRAAYAQRMAELAAPGALLAGFFFFAETPKGPPFGIERAELERLLGSSFELIEDEPVSGSIPIFEGRERWLTWRRRESR
ncbi:methyltransferase domain-containing protein [Paraburkholderia sp.]|uniref:methyltransferase domain-containing protein n=1 Tax=Paraburkholderia sp. TaxID=1926495 RepID=UPI003D6EE78D